MYGRLTALLTTLALLGCGGESKVVRVYDGRIVEGKYVSPDAYAWFLRGVLAEDGGDLDGAVGAYEQAIKEDDDDAEVWARLGGALCKRNPKDGAVDKAFSRALAVDATYAGALAAKARCELGRGNAAVAAADAQKAAHEDPANVEIEALLVRAEARGAGGAASSGERAIALTLAYGERPAAWEALVAWGQSKNRADLVARGLEGLLRAAPARSSEVERGAVELLGDGHTGLARRVAAAIADSPRELLVRGPRDATVARLAVDEALARGDEATATARATRGRVELAEVAARAVVLERREVAARIARVVAHADPGSSAAHMVLAALTGSSKSHHPGDVLVKVGDEAPEICALVLADRIAESAGADAARTWLSKVSRRAMAAHDPLAGPLAVDLAARGVLGPSELGQELAIELAARRREPPPPLEKTTTGADVDTKHAFLLAAMTEPTGAVARALVLRLANAADDDPLVAFAIARITLATLAAGATAGDGALDHVRRAAASAPTDPLVLSALVELAMKAARGEDLAPMRSRLMAVARTPAERALATE
jgi:tetratricopeptide (TPR) repeat protein